MEKSKYSISEKIADTAAGIISIVTSPLLMPTYGVVMALWSTYLKFAPAGTRLIVLIVTFFATTVIPAMVILILSKIGVVKSVSLNERTDRPYVYAAAAMSYLAVTFYLTKVNSPQWLWMFMLSGAVIAVVTMVVNFRWKISGHATGIGALTALSFFLCFRNYNAHNNEWLFVGMTLLAGAVMTSRLILKRHTLGQVIAGFANGALWVSLSQLIAAPV